MPLTRTVVPELLDELPPEDPRAIKSRRDLRRLNAIMGHVEYFARTFIDARIGWSFEKLVELGAGDGHFALKFARRLAPVIGPMQITLVDRLNLVSPEIQANLQKLGWQAEVVVADVFEWLPEFAGGSHTGIIANLFLHHFPEAQLRKLLAQAASQCACFVACDPHRSRFALAASRLVGLVGCNSVTRHDAVMSVRAGFRGQEISHAWPEDPDWHLQEKEVGLFSHGFIARLPHKG